MPAMACGGRPAVGLSLLHCVAFVLLSALLREFLPGSTPALLSLHSSSYSDEFNCTVAAIDLSLNSR